MRFQFQYTLCAEDFIALNTMLNQTGSGKRTKLFRGVFALFGVLLGGAGIMYLQQGQYASGAFIALVGAYFFYRMYTFGRLGKRQAAKLAAGAAGARCVTLEEDGIRMHDDDTDALTPYGEVQALNYLEPRYFLVFNQQRILMLSLPALTEGDPELLRPFLEAKLDMETNELV